MSNLSCSIPVALKAVGDYDSPGLERAVFTLFSSLVLPDFSGATVLLKPNLVSGTGHSGLACSEPAMVAAVARFFVDIGCRVRIGDSPAFGGGRRVMEKFGITRVLSGLPVEVVDFDRGRRVRLASGVRVVVAEAALDCDLLVSLPRVKTHVQMLITLGVKNLFGTVVGWRKPWLHARLGDRGSRFAAMFVDLLNLFPRVLTLADGIVAMEGRGPIGGAPVSLGFLAGSMSPVALDTVILDLIGVERGGSPVWRECARRDLAGCDSGSISFPLESPADFSIPAISLPEILEPESFNPLRLAVGAVRRIKAGLAG